MVEIQHNLLKQKFSAQTLLQDKVFYRCNIVLFGASRLPEIGSGIGEAIKNLKKSMSELHEIDVTPKIKYDRILTI
jgi:TatA/E family protein of Tat protein translocase